MVLAWESREDRANIFLNDDLNMDLRERKGSRITLRFLVGSTGKIAFPLAEMRRPKGSSTWGTRTRSSVWVILSLRCP